MTPAAGVWTDRDGRPRHAPEPGTGGSGYAAIGDFQGAAYERNAFARGTGQEVAFLVAALGLGPGTRVVDVGCGTGRHARGLRGRGIRCVGVDVSLGLLSAAAARVPGDWVQADAAALPIVSGWADAALCLCQGGFGITPEGDERVVAELARVLRPGGLLALTAFSAWFAARYLAPEDAVDIERGLVHSRADVRGPDGQQRWYDLWSTCYTPPHLRALLLGAGLEVRALAGVEPGKYDIRPPTLRHPELLALARRGSGTNSSSVVQP